MSKQLAWYDYASDVRATIDRLPGDSKEGARRFQIALESHLTAQSEYHYRGTFSDWYYMIERFRHEAKAVA
jgi:hypothetical protein